MKAGIYLGLERVDPNKYGGWDGDCPGCDCDAFAMACMCAHFDSKALLVNEQATMRNLQLVFSTAVAQLAGGGLLALCCSSHGGQQPDTSGDEMDGKDETLCLFDGELVDDRIAEFLVQLPASVRVFMVTDSCNSGSNFRSRGRDIQRSTPVNLARGVPPDMQAQLIHYGGCEDGRSSYGSVAGGVFTNALGDALDEADGDLSYLSWFTAAAERMPRNQVPVYAEFGPVTDEFRNARALT